jgi:hypothetical protein
MAFAHKNTHCSTENNSTPSPNTKYTTEPSFTPSTQNLTSHRSQTPAGAIWVVDFDSPMPREPHPGKYVR